MAGISQGIYGEIRISGETSTYVFEDVEAGEILSIAVLGRDSRQGRLEDPLLVGVFGPDGELVGGPIDDGGSGRDSLFTFVADVAGDYSFEVGSADGGIGSYNIRVYELFEETIDDPGEVSSISFDGFTAGYTYLFEMRGFDSGSGTLADPLIEGIYDEFGNEVHPGNNNSGPGSDSRVFFVPNEDGQYEIRLTGDEGTTGDYILAYANNGYRDDFDPGFGRGAGTLVFGDPAAGEIEVVGDQDRFEVVLEENRTYTITLGGANLNQGTLGDPLLIGVYDPEGNLVIGPIDNTLTFGEGEEAMGVLIPDVITSFTAASSGTFSVLASGTDDSIGTYSISIETIGYEDDFAPGFAADPGEVFAGDFVTGVIEVPEDQDEFDLDVELDFEYFIDLRGVDSGSGTLGNPNLLGVYNGFGDLIVGPNDDGGEGRDSFLSFIAEETDTYYILAGSTGDSTGSYELSVSFVAPYYGPLPEDDDIETDEDVAITFNPLVNDVDANGDALFTIGVGEAAHGTAVQGPGDTIIYTPDADFFGLDSFTYTVSDLEGDDISATATVFVTVNPVEDNPIAIDDIAATDEDVAVTVAVLGNDSDPDGTDLVISGIENVIGGTALVELDNTVTFMPTENFFGTGSFTYEITNENDLTDTATVTITVAPIADAPIALADTAQVDENASVVIDALSNDIDPDQPDGSELSYVEVGQGSIGSTIIQEDGNILYTPDVGIFGTDSFVYTVTNLAGLVDSGLVTVEILNVNDAPEAVDDLVQTDEYTSIAFDVLFNDSDYDGDTLTLVSVTQPENGSVESDPNGTVSYHPDGDFFGTETFEYTVSDGQGAESTATVTVIVDEVFTPPEAVGDSVETLEDTSVLVDVLANDSDFDGDVLSVAAVTQAGSGTVVLSEAGAITYTPDTDFFGEDSFTYSLSDGTGLSATATVNVVVNAVNDAPVALDDTVTVDEDGFVLIDVTENDADVDLDVLSITAIGTPSNGSAVAAPDGAIRYTPDPDFFGVDSFTYTIADPDGAVSTATVSVTIAAQPDAPVASDDNATTDEDAAVTIAVLDNDVDVDLEALAVSSGGPASHGQVQVNADNTITYTPDADFFGEDSFDYTITDPGGATDTATVSITVAAKPDAPVASDDNATTDEDAAVMIAVLDNDVDADNEILSVSAAGLASHGQVQVNADNTITYTPDADFNGTDAFEYTVLDTSGSVDTATVTITVDAVNDLPTAENDVAQTLQGASVEIAVLSNDDDVEDDLQITSAGPATGGVVTILESGVLRYTPNAEFLGADSFSYTALDSDGAEVSATVDVDVLQDDDFLPSTADLTTAVGFGSISVNESQLGTINFANDIDVFETNLVTGRVYEIRMTSNGPDGESQLDPFLSGVSIVSAAGGAGDIISGSVNDDAESLNSRAVFSSSVSGAHFISATGLRGSVGDYTISLTDLGIVDDFAADIFTTGTASAASAATGVLEFDGDQDWFRVTLDAGQRYAIRLQGTEENPIGDLGIEGLYDAQGNLIAGANAARVVTATGEYDELVFTPTTGGTFFVSAAAGFGDTGAYSISVDAITPEDPGFNLQLDYFGDADLRQYFEAAAEKWEDVITGDLPSASIDGVGNIEDIRLRVDFVDDDTLSFDGVTSRVRAITFVTNTRETDDGHVLPYSASITIGREFARFLGDGLLDLAVNAIGRGLGFGSLWEANGLLETTEDGVRFAGENALREFENTLGLPGALLLEDGENGGLQNQYWDEESFSYSIADRYFFSEVMTSLFTYAEGAGIEVNNVLSRVTIGAMNDLGYQVNYAADEDYGPNVSPATGPINSGPATDGGEETETPQLPPSVASTLAARLEEMVIDQHLTVFDPDFAQVLAQPQVLGNDNTSISGFTGASFNLFETATDANYILFVEGDFQRNNPLQVEDIRGDVSGVTVFTRFGKKLLELSDFAKEMDIQELLSNWVSVDFDGNNAISNQSAGNSIIEVNTNAAFLSSIVADEGDDFITGNDEAEYLVAGDGNDVIIAGAGNDILVGGNGHDFLIGGDGIDVASQSGAQSHYTLTLSADGTTLEDRRATGDGTDQLFGVELLDFGSTSATGPFELSKFEGAAGLTEDDLGALVEMYIGYFNRAPDAVGLFFWGTALQEGYTLEEIAELFMDQDETRSLYADDSSNEALATSVYNNVLGRVPDLEGFNFWVNAMDSGVVSRGTFILEVLRGAKAEFKPENGDEFVQQQQADRDYLAEKTDIGTYFAVVKGMSERDDAIAVMQLFDGSEASVVDAISATDGFFADASNADTGDFLMPLIGVVQDPFEI